MAFTAAATGTTAAAKVAGGRMRYGQRERRGHRAEPAAVEGLLAVDLPHVLHEQVQFPAAPPALRVQVRLPRADRRIGKIAHRPAAARDIDQRRRYPVAAFLVPEQQQRIGAPFIDHQLRPRDGNRL